jgi:phosphatidylinositol alpha-1,6-mannosyltransferase
MSLVIGLFTQVLSPGGVQRASRHAAAVLAAFAAERGYTCRFLSLNDPQGLHSVRVGSNEFSVTGHARDKAQFVLAALRAAGRDPVLVVALHPNLAPIVWAMRFRSRKFKSIVFAHGIEVWQPLPWARRQALRQADRVVGPSTDTVRHLAASQGVSSGKIQRLAWGLDPEFEERLASGVWPALPAGFPADGKIILTVGRWDPKERYKGADTLISALPRVLENVPDAYLVLVGDGADRSRLEQLARDAGVSDHVRFLAGLTQDELFACYAASAVFALPSKGEGFGLVFLEAMAHGKPVIGGDHGGTPDVVEDGVTGWLVPHGEIERLAEALKSLLADSAKAAEMGGRGRTRVEQFFSFQQFQRQFIKMLDDVLLGKPT